MDKGFSLVEAMVIVTIIGILATLVYSRYNYHIAKTRQAEAKNNLNHLAVLQEAYALEHNKYFVLKPIGLKRSGGYACLPAAPGEGMRNDLGFRPKNCKELRYEYWGIDTDPQFKMRAASKPSVTEKYIWPDCDTRDEWRIMGGSGVDPIDSVPHQHHYPERQVLKTCK